MSKTYWAVAKGNELASDKSGNTLLWAHDLHDEVADERRLFGRGHRVVKVRVELVEDEA